MGKRVMAHFQPQAWINDCAVDIDGAMEFDVTDQIEAMGREAALRIRDYSDEADNLWLNSAESKTNDHNGPLVVVVEDSIRAFFGEK